MNNNFKDFGISAERKNLTGEKIKITKILNKPVDVLAFQINPSKYQKTVDDKCLKLQIQYEGETRVVFSGSTFLMDMIQKVPPNKFPFNTTIIEKDEAHLFT